MTLGLRHFYLAFESILLSPPLAKSEADDRLGALCRPHSVIEGKSTFEDYERGGVKEGGFEVEEWPNRKWSERKHLPTDRPGPSLLRPSTGRSRFRVEVKAEIEERGVIGNNEFRRMTDRGGREVELQAGA